MTGVFNVARGERVSILDVARSIIQITGSRSRVVHAAERPGDVRHSMADISKIRSIGFEPAPEKAEGVRETMDYFRDLFGSRF